MLRVVAVLLLPPSLLAAIPARAGALRLIDRLDAAEIHSPLLDLKATSALGDHVEAEPLLHQTFERARPTGWRGAPGCVAVARPGGDGRALRYVGRNSHRCFFLLPAEPSTHYRLERAILAADPRIDFRVIETRVALARPRTLNHADDVRRVMNGRFVRMANLLYVHRFPRPEAGAWGHGSLSIYTSPKTRSLILLLNDAEGTVTGKSAEAYFDDIRAFRLAPTRAQELALLKAAQPGPGADPQLGIAKHGRFLPIGDAETVRPPYDANFSFREALFAPAPSRLEFDLHLPRQARLHVSCALHTMSRAGDDATFRVLARPQGRGETTLFEHSIRLGPEGENWRWFDARIDLAAVAGRRARLILETSASEGSRGYALWGSPTIDTPRQAQEPPNILLIGVDTLRADRLSTYGYSRPTSPRLDALARDGITFTQAVSPSNWTSPAFASLFTGMMPSQHQVIHRARAIAPAVETLAERFRAGGWVTHAVAYKAYLFNMGFEQGFDTFFNVPRTDVRADDNVATALAWLRRNADRRFFLFLHFNDPHQPFNQPAPFQQTFNSPRALSRFGLRLPFVIDTAGEVRGCTRCSGDQGVNSVFRSLARDLYDGEIRYVDDRIGRVIDYLVERGLYDDTIIALVSDHGEIMWEHSDYFGHGGPWMVDPLIRVPLIVKPAAGAGLARGKVVETQVRTHDLMPTLLDMAGIAGGGAKLAAASLMPFLVTQGRGPAVDRVAISENIKQDVIAVRAGGWKYVLRHAKSSSERLYNLRIDPGERVNVADKEPERLHELRGYAVAHLLEHRRGRYLVVTGSEKRRTYRVRLRSSERLRGVQTILGPRLQRLSGRTWSADGRAEGPVVLLARFEGSPNATLDVTVDRLGRTPVRIERRIDGSGFDTFVDDTAPRLWSAKRVALHVFETAPAILHAERRGMSAQRLETLKALGYVQ